ncbi:MAG: disulfide bond formation protein B [Burkholderiales bacterium]|nr:disulfide bond formation protein B [Burkholderiales bacterium]
MNNRYGYLAGFLACVGLIAFALYLQYVVGEDPCPLCLLQRIVFMGLGVVFLVAAMHGPRRVAAVMYGVLLLLLAAVGGAIAGRHVWLQSLPKNMVPECGPGLDYILSRFPLRKALDMVLRGSGECAEKGWTFLGVSIAGWSLVWFVLLAALAFALTLRATQGSGAGRGAGLRAQARNH